MLNYIWFALMIVALVVAVFTGKADALTAGALDSAKTAVEISIGLIGIMALWLGMMKVADRAGLIRLLARLIAPVTRVLFPEVPRDHPAMGSMIMNIAANMLGLSNAATPLGIRAMEDLQELNKGSETASNSMVMFLALNTASVQLIPATAIAVMAAAGSKQPTAIIGTTLMATIVGAISAVTAARVLQTFFPYREETANEAPAEPVDASSERATEGEE